jgi:hypothetical protein
MSMSVPDRIKHLRSEFDGRTIPYPPAPIDLLPTHLHAAFKAIGHLNFDKKECSKCVKVKFRRGLGTIRQREILGRMNGEVAFDK